MARDLVDENYYISNGGMIPVKWTAPEASWEYFISGIWYADILATKLIIDN